MKRSNPFSSFFLAAFVLSILSCNTGDEDDFQKQLSVISDTMEIDNTKDNLISGSKGTELFFEKESFILPDGSSPNGPVSIHLKECYNISDMVRENLSTSANQQILQTQGMINVRAFSGNQELNLKEGKKFVVHFPIDTTARQKRMNLCYGETNKQGNINWKMDSLTLLRPTAFMTGWMITGWPGGDSTKVPGFYFKDEKEVNISDYFYKNFDNTRLQSANDMLDRTYEVNFTVTRLGKITNIRIKEEIFGVFGETIPSKTKPDPYFYEYIRNIPALEPFYFDNGGKLEPFDAESNFYIHTALYPPDYRSNQAYNNLFNQKYSAFKNTSIQTINYAELKYYIFSASKLGWINCDFFWETPDEKIDYVVKVDPSSKPNIKLVFKQVKSIMSGTLEGDKFIFKNIPLNQDIKIVAIAFKGNKPLLAVSESRTDRQIFDRLDFKEFAIADLEKHLNSP